MNTNKKGRQFESEIALHLKEVGYDIVFRPPPTTRWQKHVDFGPTTIKDAGIDLVGYKKGKLRLVQCKGYKLYPAQIKRLKDALGAYWAALAALNGEVWLVYKVPEHWGRENRFDKFFKEEIKWERCV